MSAGPPLRIGIVAPTTEIVGGHAVQAARLLNAWRGDPEVQVRLLPINPALPRALSWLKKIRFVRTIANQARYWPALLRDVPKVDALHVFCPSNGSFFLSALPAMLVARVYGKPVIANHRGDSGDRLAASPTMRRLLATSAANVSPSVYFQHLARAVGIEAQVVPNLCDAEQFTYRVRDPLRPRLLSTRNFEPIYNVACTLRAFRTVQAAHASASLVLVGDGSERRALESLARALDLRHVHFAGPVAPSEIHHYYDAADLYIQTPIADNMPGSLIEAFASGLPVVSTEVGGIPAILTDRVHGLLASSNDHEAIARAVCDLLDDPAGARRMAAAAYETCRRYMWASVGTQWRAVYRAVVAAHSMRDLS